MRVLAVDHGGKHIGVSVSDPTGLLARPLAVLEHTSRMVDAARVAELASEQKAGLIIVGQSFDEAGLPNRAGRSAARFAEALKRQSEIPVLMWDESMSTQDAQASRLAAGTSRKGRRAPVDAAAAAMILQSYLDSPEGLARRREARSSEEATAATASGNGDAG